MSIYKIGQVTLTNGSTAIVGIGTAWALALVTGGVLAAEASGNPLPLASVESDTAATSAVEWTGTTGTYNYAIAQESSAAASIVDLNTRLAGILVRLSLVGIHPDGSGTLTERDALDPVPATGYLWLHAELGVDFAFYRKVASGYDGPFSVEGEGPAGPIGPMGPDGDITWEGAWLTATAYTANQAVSHGGSSYVCIESHTSGTFATDLGADKWELMASKGDTGATGATGAPGDMTLANDVIDEDDMASDSDTKVPTQQSVKAYVDANALAGHLFGLTLSNNVTDSTNDINIAIGSTASIDTVPVLMTLTGALTKRLDAAWAVGTNQGGRMSAAAITDTTYHVWLIRRSDTGVVDVGFDVSATAPTMPANYDQKRRIGSIIRASGAIVAFRQTGDIFKRGSVEDRNSTAAAASALLAVSVPTGIVCQPILQLALSANASTNCLVSLGDAADTGAGTPVANVLTGAGDSTDGWQIVIPPVFSTNTSAQVYFSQTNSAGTPTASILRTYGWIDTRGRE